MRQCGNHVAMLKIKQTAIAMGSEDRLLSLVRHHWLILFSSQGRLCCGNVSDTFVNLLSKIIEISQMHDAESVEGYVCDFVCALKAIKSYKCCIISGTLTACCNWSLIPPQQAHAMLVKTWT